MKFKNIRGALEGGGGLVTSELAKIFLISPKFHWKFFDLAKIFWNFFDLAKFSENELAKLDFSWNWKPKILSKEKWNENYQERQVIIWSGYNTQWFSLWKWKWTNHSPLSTFLFSHTLQIFPNVLLIKKCFWDVSETVINCNQKDFIFVHMFIVHSNSASYLNVRFWESTPSLSDHFEWD